jgi:cbb3-type cytochrome oxidase subunit 3
VIKNPDLPPYLDLRMETGDTYHASMIFDAAWLLLFALACFGLKKTGLNLPQKAALVLVLYIAILLASPLVSRVPLSGIHPFILMIAAKLMFILALVIFFNVTQRALFQTSFSLAMAGAIGNTLSYAYHPCKPVDFLWLNILPDIVFNFADVYVAAAEWLLFLAILYWLFQTLRREYRKQERRSRLAPSQKPEIL